MLAEMDQAFGISQLPPTAIACRKGNARGTEPNRATEPGTRSKRSPTVGSISHEATALP